MLTLSADRERLRRVPQIPAAARGRRCAHCPALTWCRHCIYFKERGRSAAASHYLLSDWRIRKDAGTRQAPTSVCAIGMSCTTPPADKGSGIPVGWNWWAAVIFGFVFGWGRGWTFALGAGTLRGEVDFPSKRGNLLPDQTAERWRSASSLGRKTKISICFCDGLPLSLKVCVFRF